MSHSFNIHSISQPLPYPSEPLALYQTLTEGRDHHLLYESADVDHQHALKSFLLIDACLAIKGLKDKIEITALTGNGQALLTAIAQQPIKQAIAKQTDHAMIFLFSKGSPYTPLDILRTLQRLADPQKDNEYAIFMAGLLGYDLVDFYYDIPTPDNGRENDITVYVAETLIIIDHVTQSAEVQHNQFSENEANRQFFQTHLKTIQEIALNQQSKLFTPIVHKKIDATVTEDDPAEYLNTVSELIQRVQQGEFQQIVPSRRFEIACPAPMNAYYQLKQSHPSPYLFYLQDSDFTLFGASPERALKFDHQTRLVELYPIAGTRPRGRVNDVIDATLDQQLEVELKNDPKEVSEHMMLVRLAEQELATIAEEGTVFVKDLMKIDRYAYVMHLVSNVQAKLKPNLDAMDAYIATMNMGTLTGDPKINAMKTIYEYETVARGSYGGAVGYMNGFGDLDSCIVIRSANVNNGIATIQAGAGIVKDSIPESELAETRHKASSVIKAIQRSHNANPNT